MSTQTIALRSINEWLADGSQTVWNFSFAGGYISKSHVKAYKTSPLNVRQELTINNPGDFVGAFQLTITGVAAGWKLGIYRDSSNGGVPLVNFADGANFTELSMDTVAQQSVFVSAEADDQAELATLAASNAVVDASEATAAAEAAEAAAANAVSVANTANSTADSALSIASAAADDVNDAIVEAQTAAAAATAASATATAAAADAAEAAQIAQDLADSLVNPYSANGGPISGDVSIAGMTTLTGGARTTEFSWPATGNIRWKATRESDGTWQLRRYDSAGTFQTTSLTVDPTTGHVGVNVAPVVKLHTKSTGELTRVETTTARGSGNAYTTFYDPTGRKGYFGYGSGSNDNMQIANDLAANIEFYTNTSQQMIIDAAGKIGMGGTSTGAKLWINSGGSIPLHVEATSGAQAYATFAKGGTTYGYLGDSLGLMGTTTGTMTLRGENGLAFSIANTRKMLLDTIGNFGIGGVPNAYTSDVTALTINAASVPLIDFNIAGVRKATIDFNPAAGGFVVGTITNDALAFYQNGTERARVPVSASRGEIMVGYQGASPHATANRSIVQIDGANTLLGFSNAGAVRGYIYHDNTDIQFLNAIGGITFATGGSTRMSISAAGVIADVNGLELGYRKVPRITTYPSGGYVGKCVALSAGITINTTDGITTGDAWSFYNDSASAVTVTQGGGMTLRLAGTTTTGSRTLASRGIMTFWANSATELLCSGPGVS